MTRPPLRPRALLLDAVPEGVDLAHGVGHRCRRCRSRRRRRRAAAVLSTCASTRACAWIGRGRAPRPGARPGCAGRARHDDEVERVVDGGLDEERNVVDHDGVGVFGLDLRHDLGGQLADRRVHDGVEPRACVVVVEHEVGELLRSSVPSVRRSRDRTPRRWPRAPACRARRPCGRGGRRRGAPRRARPAAGRQWTFQRRCRP